MIKIFTQADADSVPTIFEEMYRARAAVFRDRHGWDVVVRDGLEIDRCDRVEDPVYVTAWASDQMVGSLRLLPSTGETMLRHEFAAMFDEPVDFASPTAWECSRLCIHPCASSSMSSRDFQNVSTELLAGLCDLALRSGIEQVVALYDQRMTRVFRRIGWCPQPMAETLASEGERLIVGIWDVTPSIAVALAAGRAASHAVASHAA